MAHELEFANGAAQMAYAGDIPWHGLGKEVSPDLTPDQMMKEAGLDWEVNKVPLYAELGEKRVYSGAEALVRSTDNRILDVVTQNWNPCQNREAFEFFNDFIGNGDMQMHTAGSLRNGKYVWALAKVNESFDLFGGDKVDSYLLFSNPHQFGKSITVQFTPIRVVCMNTLSLSLSTKADRMLRVDHRQSFNGDSVKETLGIAKEKLTKYKEMAAFLGSKLYTAEALLNYFKEVFPSSSQKEEAETSRAAKLAREIVHVQPGHDYAEGSWWQAYNAVTYLTDHELGRTNDNRMFSSWFGTNKDRKIKALNLAVEMAEAS